MLNRNSTLFLGLKNCFSGHKAASSLLALGLIMAPTTMHTAFAEVLSEGKATWYGKKKKVLTRRPSCTIVGTTPGKLAFNTEEKLVTSFPKDLGEHATLTITTGHLGSMYKLSSSNQLLMLDDSEVTSDYEIKTTFSRIERGSTGGVTGHYNDVIQPYLTVMSGQRLKEVKVGIKAVYQRQGELPEGTFTARQTVTCQAIDPKSLPKAPIARN